jgi:rfaE bifunctional protein nucleotidyltransferase chain/domain
VTGAGGEHERRLAGRLEALLGGAEVSREAVADCASAAMAAAQAIADSLAGGGKVLLFGNGGSAADAQHMAAELLGRFELDRPALPALALTTDSSTMTAIANDLGYERIFARQIEGLAASGDVALAISTSGSSPNVLAGVRAARERGARTVALTGAQGSELAAEAELVVASPGGSTARVQEGHLVIEHAICEYVEASAGAGRPAAPAGRAVDWEELDELRERWRRQGSRVVWTNGCFDLIHAGHVRSLTAAKSFGDVLVVGVNGDDSVRRLKGPGRPILELPQRVEILAALRPVDYVVVFDEDTPEKALQRLKPDIHSKGAQYAPPNGRPMPERAAVEAYGGRVEFLPELSGISTSAVIDRVAESRRGGDAG